MSCALSTLVEVRPPPQNQSGPNRPAPSRVFLVPSSLRFWSQWVRTPGPTQTSPAFCSRSLRICPPCLGLDQPQEAADSGPGRRWRHPSGGPLPAPPRRRRGLRGMCPAGMCLQVLQNLGQNHSRPGVYRTSLGRSGPNAGGSGTRGVQWVSIGHHEPKNNF